MPSRPAVRAVIRLVRSQNALPGRPVPNLTSRRQDPALVALGAAIRRARLEQDISREDARAGRGGRSQLRRKGRAWRQRHCDFDLSEDQ